MVFIRYPQLMNHTWLAAQLETQSIAEMVAVTGIPYNSISNQVRQMSPELRAKINRGRLSWSLEEKGSILKQAQRKGYSNISRKYGISPAVLSRWRRELGIMYDQPLKRGRPANPEQRAI